MQKNSGDFSMEEAMAFANSDAGKRLFAMLQQSGSQSMQKAMDALSKGNMEQAKAALRNASADPQIQKIMKNFGG